MPKIQHTVIFPLIGLSDENTAVLQGIVAKFNEIPGIVASFRPSGGPGGMSMDEIFAVEGQVFEEKGFGKGKGKGEGEGEGKGKGKGKMGVLEGYTYCLMVIADDVPALKSYLHGDAHKEWGPAVRPFFSEGGKPIVFDSDWLLSDVPPGKIQHTKLIKLDGLSAEGAAKASEAVAELSKLPGVKASFAPAGVGGMSLGDTLAALDWPDKTDGFTHILTVLCDDAHKRAEFLCSEPFRDFRHAIAQPDGEGGHRVPYFCPVESEWSLANL